MGSFLLLEDNMIRYRIIQDIEELKNMTAKELIDEDEVYGFFNITFKDNQIGDYLSTTELPLDYALDNNLYVYHDCLFWWFESIYKVLVNLEHQDVVNVLDLESDSYLYIFKKNNKILEIKSIQLEKNHNNNNKLDDDDNFKIDFVEKVSYHDFIEDYKSAFTSFRNELLDINKNFECINIIKEINEWIKLSKS